MKRGNREILSVGLSEQLAAFVAGEAELYGISKNAYVRALIVARMRRRAPDDPIPGAEEASLREAQARAEIGVIEGRPLPDGVCDQWGADEAKELLGLDED